ncbi:MAG: hypothetical protein JSU86_00940 [Phycisphaerales bacterium]|nr:MAG: hypothetical protein JSU86_00940 [Phycisphaerales bacterium]
MTSCFSPDMGPDAYVIFVTNPQEVPSDRWSSGLERPWRIPIWVVIGRNRAERIVEQLKARFGTPTFCVEPYPTPPEARDTIWDMCQGAAMGQYGDGIQALAKEARRLWNIVGKTPDEPAALVDMSDALLNAAATDEAASGGAEAVGESETASSTQRSGGAPRPGLHSAPEIAEHYSLELPSLDQRLRRWREKHPDDTGWSEIADQRSHEAKYRYDETAVWHIITDLRGKQ